MKPTDKNILEKVFRKIKSIMREQFVNKLTIQRQYLSEIFDADLLEIYEDLPILKPFVENYLRSRGISIELSSKEIKFMETAIENLEDVLKIILESNPEVKAAAIVSTEGLPIVSVLPRGIDETKISAMTAALLSLAKTAVIEMKKGEFEQLFIKGNDGYLLVLQAGPNAVLTVSTTKDAKLGLIFLEYHRAYKKFFVDLSNDEDLSEEEYLYCKHCGAELLTGQTICHVCGKKLD